MLCVFVNNINMLPGLKCKSISSIWIKIKKTNIRDFPHSLFFYPYICHAIKREKNGWLFALQNISTAVDWTNNSWKLNSRWWKCFEMRKSIFYLKNKGIYTMKNKTCSLGVKNHLIEKRFTSGKTHLQCKWQINKALTGRKYVLKHFLRLVSSFQLFLQFSRRWKCCKKERDNLQ